MLRVGDSFVRCAVNYSYNLKKNDHMAVSVTHGYTSVIDNNEKKAMCSYIAKYAIKHLKYKIHNQLFANNLIKRSNRPVNNTVVLYYLPSVVGFSFLIQNLLLCLC